ncbi:hypothetical protein AACH06_29755 [Ideonella sp. DXS29W]|uniref:Uncharacterized protein n=1 Tax=Ideonella lacteola TaxID=2984193 RepID=A0ABU9BYF1_9BURK
MQPSSKFSLKELPKTVPFATYRRRLFTDGGIKGSIVNGDKIEFEFSSGHHIVLATSYDYFDGCEHWIYLLSPAGEILDLVAMPNVFGFTQDVEVIGPEELSFGYFGTNDRWSLHVWEVGYWSFSLGMVCTKHGATCMDAEEHGIWARDARNGFSPSSWAPIRRA